MNKWNEWYNSLPEHTKQYLDKQPVWHDSDLLKFTAVAFIAGLILGMVI